MAHTNGAPLAAETGSWRKNGLLGQVLLTLVGRSVAGRMGTGDMACGLLNEFRADPLWNGMGEGVAEDGQELCRDSGFFQGDLILR